MNSYSPVAGMIKTNINNILTYYQARIRHEHFQSRSGIDSSFCKMTRYHLTVAEIPDNLEKKYRIMYSFFPLCKVLQCLEHLDK